MSVTLGAASPAPKEMRANGAGAIFATGFAAEAGSAAGTGEGRMKISTQPPKIANTTSAPAAT
ncbi:MAG: hypothetical protein WDO13_04365 [Verrucomicrobiota bacterium]